VVTAGWARVLSEEATVTRFGDIQNENPSIAMFWVEHAIALSRAIETAIPSKSCAVA